MENNDVKLTNDQEQTNRYVKKFNKYKVRPSLEGDILEGTSNHSYDLHLLIAADQMVLKEVIEFHSYQFTPL